jgi:glycosyltransferase involved in cell wall biosynthesis
MGPLIEAAGVPVRSLGLRRGVPDPRGILRIIRILRGFQPTVLQTWLYHADLLGLIVRELRQVPHLVWGLQCSESIDAKVVRAILARSSARPDAIVTVSQAGRRVHEALGYRPRRWVHIPNAVDTRSLHFSPDARAGARARLGIAEERLAILLPARYHPMKDHATFLAAAAIMARACPQALFVLAGAGTEPNDSTLGRVIAAHRLVDRVLPLGERDDLEALYPAFDIVSLSSAFGEGLPLVLAEAMAFGIPCVATDSGDTATLIGDTGEIVPPRQPEALAAAWQRVALLGRNGRDIRGAQARARIEAYYDLDSIAKRYAELYEEIAAEPIRRTQTRDLERDRV